jgi:hypothetical protein
MILRRALFIISLGLLGLFLLHMELWAAGFLFGGCAGLLNFRLLAMDVRRVLHLNEKEAFRFARNHAILRYLICGVSLSMAFIIGGKEAFFGTFIGLLVIKIAIFTLYIPLGRLDG